MGRSFKLIKLIMIIYVDINFNNGNVKRSINKEKISFYPSDMTEEFTNS